KDNRNSIRKEVLHLIKFVKKTVAIPSTTQVYAHISPEVKKRSMNQLENYIEEQIKKHSN
ncbi:hypothetical protein R6K74_11810, partial [Enterococcus faecium]|nr:hypothetical protein [Enterococcus faecium]